MYKFPDRLVRGSDSAFVSTAAELKFNSQCFRFPSPNLQWLTSFDSRKLYPLFGWPSSYHDSYSYVLVQQ